MLTAGMAEAWALSVGRSLFVALVAPLEATPQWLQLTGQQVDVKRSLCFAL